MSDRPAVPSRLATQVALRFVADLQAGKRPRIEEALAAAPLAEYSALLQSCLIAEVNLRRSRGEAPTAGEYLSRFPADAAAVRAVFGSLPIPVAATVPIAVPVAQSYRFDDFARDDGPVPRRRARRSRVPLIGGALAVAGAIALVAVRPWASRNSDAS